MRNAEVILAIVRERGAKGLPLENVYRQLYNPDLYLKAYGKLAPNQGAMTRGVTEETVDGMSTDKIGKIIELLRNERFKWSPVRRVLIPKGNGKTRPLGIPNFSPDRLLQEVMRSIMEAYYEPQFSLNSHGFRPERGCHTALKDIAIAWKGTKWFIEGDIKGCFDNIDHTILVSNLREKIHDNRFLILVENLLRAGYLEEWCYRPTYSGTPQGGVISPLLANIYLDKLDKFVEQTLIPEYTKGTRRKWDREYKCLENKLTRLNKDEKNREACKLIRKELSKLTCRDHHDPDYRRLRYVRYADDFLLGFSGPRDEAETIKVRIGQFLNETLKLELSPEKTLITHAGTEMARFLGYDIRANWNQNAKSANGDIQLRIPIQKLEAKVAKYTQDGKPIYRPELMADSDFSIVERYGSEYRGVVQYYAYAENRRWLACLQWAMKVSLLKTLAAKHKSTVTKIARKYQAETYDRGREKLKCFEVRIERPGKMPLIARFGGLRMTVDYFLILPDGPTDQDHMPLGRNELLSRLLADECELCGSKDRVQVHHVRKLADLKSKGRREKPTWQQVMIARRRKTLVVCQFCHVAIHAGKPTRTHTENAMRTPQSKIEITGEPCASKVASTVRGGADGKGNAVG